MTAWINSLAVGADWYSDLWSSPLMLKCAVIAAVCIVLLIALFQLLSPFVKKPDISLIRDVRGTATIEFALVMPIVLFLCLTLAQTTLAMGGNIFVQYASFAAARSAIVQIPRDLWDIDEPHNTIDLDAGEKIDNIRRAAVFAVLPVAGRSETGTAEAEQFVEGLNDHYAAYGRDEPRWVERLAADRLRYADFNTEVILMVTIARADEETQFIALEDGRHEFGPREPITVEVLHYLNLAVPYVWPIFADSLDARDTLVTSRCTLTMEGIYTELPPRPTAPPDFINTLDRDPQED